MYVCIWEGILFPFFNLETNLRNTQSGKVVWLSEYLRDVMYCREWIESIILRGEDGDVKFLMRDILLLLLEYAIFGF